MAAVVKRLAKYGGGCVASALVAGRVFGPLLVQLQKNKTDEIITDESIIRRFDQSLIEGEARFQDELPNISEMIKTYFNIEGLAERLRTCRREEKRQLWNEMKALVFARLMVGVYLNYTAMILSKAQMILIAKTLSQKEASYDDSVVDMCRTFMDEVKGFYSILIAELCPVMIEVSKNILEFKNIDSPVEDLDSIKTIFMQLKRRADASFSIPKLMEKIYSGNGSSSKLGPELLLYCQSRNFRQILDYMICDGLDEIAIDGYVSIQYNNKSMIILSWITYASEVFNSNAKSLDDIILKKWSGENMVFSHLAVLFCENK